MTKTPEILATGKLPHSLLRGLLRKYGRGDDQILVGPHVGEDAAAIALREDVVVAGMDPITFATDEIGWYVVHVNANDVAVMGAAPRWFLVTFLLPEGRSTAQDVEHMFAQVADACREVGAHLVGGHTEVTYGLDRPLAVGVMLGEVAREKLIRTGNAQPGDVLILARGVPIEGTALIARERREDLLRRGISPRLIERAANFLHDPGISVVRAALLAAATADIHAMHDPTEGGLLTGVWELAEASGVGMWVDGDAVPVLPEGRVLCDVYGLDPLGTIASGALLLTCAESEATPVVDALGDADIPAQVIGRVLPRTEGLWIRRGGKAQPLSPPPVDEIVKIWST
ncbi:MAG: hydrogenase expression/formation protein [Chloroflexi bacterium]|nr:hydrogenase expression/formation protein [Chloroflexota bacterium]